MITAKQWIERHGGTWSDGVALQALLEAASDDRAAREFKARQYVARRRLREQRSGDQTNTWGH